MGSLDFSSVAPYPTGSRSSFATFSVSYARTGRTSGKQRDTPTTGEQERTVELK